MSTTAFVPYSSLFKFAALFSSPTNRFLDHINLTYIRQQLMFRAFSETMRISSEIVCICNKIQRLVSLPYGWILVNRNTTIPFMSSCLNRIMQVLRGLEVSAFRFLNNSNENVVFAISIRYYPSLMLHLGLLQTMLSELPSHTSNGIMPKRPDHERRSEIRPNHNQSTIQIEVQCLIWKTIHICRDLLVYNQELDHFGFDLIKIQSGLLEAGRLLSRHKLAKTSGQTLHLSH